MTHEQIKAALQRDFLREDARECRHTSYPINQRPPRRPSDLPAPPGRPDPTDFAGETCVI